MFKIETGKKKKPWKGFIYGVPGIGKTTAASHAPKPLFIDLEAGSMELDVARLNGSIKTKDNLVAAMRFFLESEHDTLVLDTAQEVESILIRHVLDPDNKKPEAHFSILDIPFGKGYEYLVGEWRDVVKIFDIINAKGKNVLLLGHETSQKYEDPTSENYDRFSPNLNKRSVGFVVGKMDFVVFARHELSLVERKGSMDKKRAIGTGRRMAHCEETPTIIAKNRFNLPPIMDFDGATLFKLIEERI